MDIFSRELQKSYFLITSKNIFFQCHLSEFLEIITFKSSNLKKVYSNNLIKLLSLQKHFKKDRGPESAVTFKNSFLVEKCTNVCIWCLSQ